MKILKTTKNIQKVGLCQKVSLIIGFNDLRF